MREDRPSPSARPTTDDGFEPQEDGRSQFPPPGSTVCRGASHLREVDAVSRIKSLFRSIPAWGPLTIKAARRLRPSLDIHNAAGTRTEVREPPSRGVDVEARPRASPARASWLHGQGSRG